MKSWPFKDPAEVYDNSFDWTDDLGGDTIATSAWAVEEGDVAKDSDDNTDDTTTVWLSGGTVDTYAVLKNTIVTNNGRTFVKRTRLRIKER